jgi:hypothetical protein
MIIPANAKYKIIQENRYGDAAVTGKNKVLKDL